MADKRAWLKGFLLLKGTTIREGKPALWTLFDGCQEVSPGCRSCTARVQAQRHAEGRYVGLVASSGWTGATILRPDRIRIPLEVRTPQVFLVNSMSDLFLENVVGRPLRATPLSSTTSIVQGLTGPQWGPVHEDGSTSDLTNADLGAEIGPLKKHTAHEFISRKHTRYAQGRQLVSAAFGVMAATPQHLYVIVTKRPGSAEAYFNSLGDDPLTSISSASRLSHSAEWPLANVIMGVSVEDQASADVRIPALHRLPAATRLVCCEPLLESIEWAPKLEPDWVVVGPETGAGARAMKGAWEDKLRLQCEHRRTPMWSKAKSAGTRPRLQVSPELETVLARAESVGATAPFDSRRNPGVVIDGEHAAIEIRGREAMIRTESKVILLNPVKDHRLSSLVEQVKRLQRHPDTPFDFSFGPAVDHMRRELLELEDARASGQHDASEDEAGDVLAISLSIVIASGLDLDQVIERVTDKLEHRIDCLDRGLSWDAAKSEPLVPSAKPDRIDIRQWFTSRGWAFQKTAVTRGDERIRFGDGIGDRLLLRHMRIQEPSTAPKIARGLITGSPSKS